MEIPGKVMKLRFCALCVCLFILFAKDSFGQNTMDTLPTFAQKKTGAAELFRKNKPAEAYEAYMKLLRESPLDGEVNLGVARSAYASNRLNQAVMAYERLIESYPDKAFLRLELSRVYAALKNHQNAKTFLDQAKLIDPTLKGIKLDDIIKQEEARNRQWFVNGNISLGYGYDSNANSGPYSSKIILGDFPLTLDPSSVQQSSEFGQLVAGLNLIYRKDSSSRLFFVSDMVFYGKYYIKDSVSDNSFLWTRVGLGIRYNWSKQYLDVRLKGDFAQYTTKKNITTVGGELTHVYFLNDMISFISRGGYEQRYYTDSPGNDGLYYSLGENLRLSFLNGDQNLTIGVKFAQRKADSPMYSNLSGEGSLRMDFNAPFEFLISPFASYRQEWYEGPGTALELNKRVDGQVRAGVSLTKYFEKYFFADLAYQYTKNFSNSAIYRYDQHTVTLSMGAQF